MKVQCDGCGTEAASVFCCADEAALCDTCDRRVHRANKLASKHRRFSLLHPSSLSSSSSSAQPPPLCDICQVSCSIYLTNFSYQLKLIDQNVIMRPVLIFYLLEYTAFLQVSLLLAFATQIS